MNENYKRVLAGLELLGGTARIDEITDATGIKNRTINNSLRSISPEYVKVIGREPRSGDARDDPKVLQLTEKGEELARETGGVTTNETEPYWALHKELCKLRNRLKNIEEAHAEQVKENRKLKRIILDGL